MIIALPSFSADFALQHETGHAINVLLDGKIVNFEAKLEALFNDEAASGQIRGYAQTSPTEYFAEAFNNFYCGKDSKAYFKEQLPKTHDFFVKNLEQPVFEADAASAACAARVFYGSCSR